MSGKRGIRSAKRQRVIDMLDATPQGLHTKDIATALGEPRNSVLKMLHTMASAGYLWSQREWVGDTHSTQTRWYLGKHREAAMAASRLAGMVDAPLGKAEKAALNIVPPRTPIVVTDAPRVVDSSQARPWAVAATARAHALEPSHAAG